MGREKKNEREGNGKRKREKRGIHDLLALSFEKRI